MMAQEMISGWHFVRDDMTLRDGRSVVVGRTYLLPDRSVPLLCMRGYHASLSTLYALPYAPGSVLCRVRLAGTIIYGTDKLVASERTVLALRDVARELRVFACDCADRALSHVDQSDPRSVTAVKVARRYAAGHATRDELCYAQAAVDTVWDTTATATIVATATDAANVAGIQTASSDAWSAASFVGSSAASAAASAAAAVSASAAASAAAVIAANATVDINANAQAIFSAAWHAGLQAERLWQREELERRMVALFEGEDR